MSDAVRDLSVYATSAPASAPALPRPVAVLHVYNYFKPDFTGDGLYFEKLFPLLARDGVHNEVIVGRTSPAPGAPPQPGVRLFGRTGGAQLNPVMLLWFLFNAWRFGVVHFHCAVDRLFAYHIIAHLSGCRIVQSSTLDDGLGSIIAGYRPIYRPIVRRLCRLIDDFIAISPSLLEDSKPVSPAQKIHFIPQGVAIPLAEETVAHDMVREAMGLSDTDTLLLFVGGICPRKDVRFLVENHPADRGDVHLMLVGPVLDHVYAAGLRTAVADSPAAGRIHLSGFMADPTPAYRAADAFVFASHKEGCPNVVLEAMSHGLPIIARRLPGTTDHVVVDGGNGLLFDTPAEYTDAVRRLATDPALRQAMGTEALAMVCSTYDMDAIARRYAALYVA